MRGGGTSEREGDLTFSLLLNLAALAGILFVLSMTLIPILERLSIREAIRCPVESETFKNQCITLQLRRDRQHQGGKVNLASPIRC